MPMTTETKVATGLGIAAAGAIITAAVLAPMTPQEQSDQIIAAQKAGAFAKPDSRKLIQDSGDYRDWLKVRTTNKNFPRLTRPMSMTEMDLVQRAEQRAKDR